MCTLNPMSLWGSSLLSTGQIEEEEKATGTARGFAFHGSIGGNKGFSCKSYARVWSLLMNRAGWADYTNSRQDPWTFQLQSNAHTSIPNQENLPKQANNPELHPYTPGHCRRKNSLTARSP